MQGTFHFIGHAAFTLSAKGRCAVFDPYLEGCPERLAPKDIRADWVFVTHGHDDHVGSAYEIAKENNALFISTAEMAGEAARRGCRTRAMHIGGSASVEFGRVKIAPAFHGAGVPGGHACGFFIDFYGARVYYAGDTGVFSDMALYARLFPVDLAILPIGDNFTMGPGDALEAVKLIGARHVIPVHYNTWPVIAQDPYAFKEVAERETKSLVHVVAPGASLDLASL